MFLIGYKNFNKTQVKNSSVKIPNENAGISNGIQIKRK
jgi:hypothetical protein